MIDIKHIKIIAWFYLPSFRLVFGQKNLDILQRSASKIIASGTEQPHPTFTKETNTQDTLRWCTSKLSEDDKAISWHQSPPRAIVNVIRHKTPCIVGLSISIQTTHCFLLIFYYWFCIFPACIIQLNSFQYDKALRIYRRFSKCNKLLFLLGFQLQSLLEKCYEWDTIKVIPGCWCRNEDKPLLVKIKKGRNSSRMRVFTKLQSFIRKKERKLIKTQHSV